MIRIILLMIIFLTSCSSDSSNVRLQEGTLLINDSEVYYRSIGQGDPIIIIHGGPVLDHIYLLPQMDQLADNYRLIYYDQRACGKSSVDVDTTTMTLQGFADDIRILADSLGIQKPNILGHSWGGLIAMKYAISYPDRIDKLILSNSIPPNTDEWQEEQKVVAEMTTEDQKQRRSAIMASGELQNDPASAIKKLLLLSFENQFYNIDHLDSLHLKVPADYMTRSQRFGYLGPDLQSFDFYDQLNTFENPALIIYGDHEPSATFSAGHMLSHFSKGQLEIIKDCGHFPFIEQESQYFEVIKTFLNNNID